MTRKEGVIWSAGFIDGEGWIGIVKTELKGHLCPVYQSRVQAAQTKRPPLDFLADTLGGRVIETKGTFLWWVPAGEVLNILRRIRPFLVNKKEQAEFVIYFLTELKRTSGIPIPKHVQAGRQRIYEQLRHLNRVGVYQENRVTIKEKEQLTA